MHRAVALPLLAALHCPLPAAAAPVYTDVLLAGVPHVEQKPDFCGEACAEMYLRRLGVRLDQDGVFAATGVDPALGRGAYTAELARGLARVGFATGDVWYRVRAQSLDDIEGQFRALHADLLRGVPSIVCMHYDGSADAPEHFRLVLGYDARSDSVVYHEPAERNGAYRRMPRAQFLSLWPLKYERDGWTLVRIRLEPKKLNADIAPAPGRGGPTEAELAQHVRALREKLPEGRFTILLARPFVVVGDGGEAEVRRTARGTVAWAVERLRAAYFGRDPREIVDIYLFHDDASYRRWAKQLFDDEPDTPYGYYSSAHHALIMNIATGGGTLVHEIVHPFMRANFPRVPAWFNEGLASLYEQSGESDGGIRGLTNWRLQGLKRAIAARDLPTFRELTAMSEKDFYEGERGDNYAQARYLCYYLQEKGLLGRYYREFARAQKEDPTGYRTLARVLGERDMDDFQRRWEKFVRGLRFP